MIRLATLFLALFVLFSCKTIKIDPPAPEFKFITEISTADPSFLSIATELSLKPYLVEADQALEQKFSGEVKQCEGVSYKYNFTATRWFSA
jgi:hypothetical protein